MYDILLCSSLFADVAGYRQKLFYHDEIVALTTHKLNLLAVESQLTVTSNQMVH